MDKTQKRVTKDLSRGVISNSDSEGKFSTEQYLLSALIRIADATEQMAKNYTQMQTDLDYYKAAYNRQREEIKQLKHSQRALRGVATKAKKKGGQADAR